jgi:hypothetical protein
MTVGARGTREGGAGGAESDEAGEGEALCGVVSGGTGRGEPVAFTSVVSAAPIAPGGACEARLRRASIVSGEAAHRGWICRRATASGSGLPDVQSQRTIQPDLDSIQQIGPDRFIPGRRRGVRDTASPTTLGPGWCGVTDRERRRSEVPRGADARRDDADGSPSDALDAARGVDASGGGDGAEQSDRVSALDHDAPLVTRFEHDGYDCELGHAGGTFYGFIRVPEETDRLHLLWELDVPGEFSYGPDADGWVGFDTGPVERDLDPREAAMALAGLAAQVGDRSRSAPP